VIDGRIDRSQVCARKGHVNLFNYVRKGDVSNLKRKCCSQGRLLKCKLTNTQITSNNRVWSGDENNHRPCTKINLCYLETYLNIKTESRNILWLNGKE
jgi:hypothetical protein